MTIDINIIFCEVIEQELSPDPLDVLEQKIAALADLLDCTEEEATRIFFSKL